MNEKQAKSEGLSFTGTYIGNYKDNQQRVKEEAKRIRDLGFRAVVVTEASGKSVYADQLYFNHIGVIKAEQELGGIENRKQYIKQEYEKRLKEIEDREGYLKKYIEDNKK